MSQLLQPKPFQLIAAPFTPFDESGQLKIHGIEPYADHLRRSTVDGAFVCGTTGESASLTLSERQAVAARWCEVANGLEIIVHVGHTCLTDAQQLARHAEQCGAHGIAATVPYYFKTLTPESALTWCAAIASAAPRTPFFYYHIPSMTGVDFSVSTLVSLAEQRIPNFAGVKFTHENLFDYGLCMDAAPGLRHFFGRDEILLSALALGARAAVGSTYNFAAPLFRRLIAAFDAGDLETARREQAHVRALVQVLVKHGGLNAMKTLMNSFGLNCGSPRLPLAPLESAEETHLVGVLKSIGFDCVSQTPEIK